MSESQLSQLENGVSRPSVLVGGCNKQVQIKQTGEQVLLSVWSGKLEDKYKSGYVEAVTCDGQLKRVVVSDLVCGCFQT